MQRLSRIFLSFLPFALIAGLLYAALFVKPEVAGASVVPPVMARGDLQYGIAGPGEGMVWGAGSDGKVWLSEDAGRTWGLQTTPTKETLQDIAAWDRMHAVAVGNQGVVIRTSDGGKSWQAVDAPRSKVANKLMRVATAADGIAWAVGEVGAVLQSKDYGATWARVMHEEDAAWNGVFVGQQKIWLAGEFGRLAASSDGGARWTSVPTPVKTSLMAIAFKDDANGVAVGLEGVVLTTQDGGANWLRRSPVTREHLFDVMWGGDSWVAVGDKGVFVTGDASGQSWQASRLASGDRAWHTKVIADGDRYIASGATLVIVPRSTLSVAGRVEKIQEKR